MGTPDFAVPTLSELIGQGHEIACVYCQPARPAGRGQSVRVSAVEAFARKAGLAVKTPASLKSAEEQRAFASLDLDAAVVVAYGLLLPRAILEAPRLGCFNVHASLLPRWRGAAPIQRAIMAGDEETGVSIMEMEEGLDTGPILMSERVKIAPETTAGTLHDLLAHLGALLMIRVLGALERGTITPVPQPERGASYAKKIDKAEARIQWTKGAAEIDRQIRALSPSPGAWFEASDARQEAVRIRVLGAKLSGATSAPGEIIAAAPLVVGCGEGALELTQLQRAGGAVMSAAEFLRGFPIKPGARLS